MLFLLACVASEPAPPAGADPADTAAFDTGVDTDPAEDSAPPEDTGAPDTDTGSPDTGDTDAGDTGATLATDHVWGSATVGDLRVLPCGSVFTWHLRVAVGPDLDGDGLAEVAFGAPNVDVTAAEQGVVYLVRGADLAGAVSLDAAWARVVGSDATAQAGFGDELQWVDDRDGDGLAELLVRSGGSGAQAVSGADLLLGGEVTATPAPSTPRTFARWDDVDGDGHADWVYGVTDHWIEYEGDDHGAVAVVSDPRFSLDGALVSDHLVAGEVPGAAAGKFVVVLTMDLDGDGHRELLTTAGGDAVVMDSSALLAGAGSLESATRWRLVGQSHAVPVVLGDADGGGLDDLAFAHGAEVCVARGELGDPTDTPLTCLDPGLGELGGAVLGGDLDGDGHAELWLGGEDATVAFDGAALAGGVLLERSRLDHPGAEADGLAAAGDSVWVSPYVAGSWGVETAAWRHSGGTGATSSTVQVHNWGAEPDQPSWMDISGDGVDDLLFRGDALYVFDGVGLRSGGEREVCDADVVIDDHVGDAWATPYFFPTGDIDGDGVTDLLTGHAGAEYGSYDAVLRSGAAAYAGAPAVLARWTIEGFFGSQLGCDVDGDGLQEFVRYAWRQPWTIVSGGYVRDGDATAALRGNLDVDDVVGCIPDVEGDGGDEVVTAEDAGSLRVFLSSQLDPARTLARADAWAELPRSRPYDHGWSAPLRLGDADGDGAEDILWEVVDYEEQAHRVCRFDAALFVAGGTLDAGAASVCTEAYERIDSVWLDDAVGGAVPEIVVVGTRSWSWSVRASDGATFGSAVALQELPIEIGTTQWQWAYGHGGDVLRTGADALWFARSDEEMGRWTLDVSFARAR